MDQNPDALQVSDDILPFPGRDLASSVAAELEPLFPHPAQPMAARRAAPDPVKVVAPPGEPVGLTRAAKIGTILATLLAGMVLGTVLLPKTGPRREPPAPAAAESSAQAFAPTLPQTPPPAPSGADAPVDRPVIILQPAPQAAEPRSQEPQALSERPRATRQPPARAARSAAGAQGCARLEGDARARCLWPEVVRADRRLRRAYNRAVEAGVSRSFLVSHRNDWDRLRRRAVRDPGQLISEYTRMAKSLEEARDRL